MGCLPAAAVVTVALPKGCGDAYAKELFLGVKEAGEVFGAPIVGGDTSTWTGKLVVTVTILGRSDGVTPITRSGAKPGDSIYVTGSLGGSPRGRHMTFVPRVNEGRHLATHGNVTAMIDLSDGISRDLAHICLASGVGAIINASAIPVHEDAIAMRRDGYSPLEHALHDGEDFELLFTSPIGHRFHRIGSITQMLGAWLTDKNGVPEPLQPKAWEHTF
jgi:thiamine-monophosphate kinase